MSDPGTHPRRRLSDTNLRVLLALAVALLAVAIGYAITSNSPAPLNPVPVASSPRA